MIPMQKMHINVERRKITALQLRLLRKTICKGMTCLLFQKTCILHRPCFYLISQAAVNEIIVQKQVIHSNPKKFEIKLCTMWPSFGILGQEQSNTLCKNKCKMDLLETLQQKIYCCYFFFRNLLKLRFELFRAAADLRLEWYNKISCKPGFSQNMRLRAKLSKKWSVAIRRVS